MNDLKRIVLIGPVYPYKGGISHYTGLMYRALSKKYDVTMVSYSFQYPKVLYKKEQRDYSNDAFKINNTQFFIHTASPLNWISSAKRINELKPDLVIIQWWHPYFAPCYQIMTKHIKAKVMFICHNVFPHERFPLDKWLTEKTLKNGDYYIVQSTQDEEDLKTIIPNAKYKRAVHPTYNAFKMQDMSKEAARQLLGIKSDEKILLFFGFVRKYKGLDYLIKAMPEVKKNLSDCRLLVVGDFGDDKDEYLGLIKDGDVSDVIDIYDGYIPDKDVEKFFAACDVVVLPYVSATQSGIVQIAYGFDKPVIATNVGGLPDVVTDGETGLLVSAQDSMAFAKAVIDFYKGDYSTKCAAGIVEQKACFSWERLVEHVEQLYFV
ncbi:glycosyltransferase family 4 protein [Butyrivibrio sp. YAB3001]|uniref:glycosyltransferase family 4 protein n=1 Tax=Butyrivibrio sp. YAB3001 TaxID=1520812 RepID=UPI000B879D19|nr:glycosyltransferase family 4 protein [Butyrivibrio sp. YAB3001]